MSQAIAGRWIIGSALAFGLVFGSASAMAAGERTRSQAGEPSGAPQLSVRDQAADAAHGVEHDARSAESNLPRRDLQPSEIARRGRIVVGLHGGAMAHLEVLKGAHLAIAEDLNAAYVASGSTDQGLGQAATAHETAARTADSAWQAHDAAQDYHNLPGFTLGDQRRSTKRALRLTTRALNDHKTAMRLSARHRQHIRVPR
jgi:hypothetical protein